MPPHLYFVVSAVFHYLGPAFAVLLFARVDVLGVAWLRIATAALLFAAWRRPWRAYRRLDREGRRMLVAWGAVLAVMNACFYVAIDRLPLATVAAIEFLPVVALAAIGARTSRNAAALVAAVAGVYLLTGVRVAGDPLGVAFAFANAGLFAAYIVLAHRVARHEALTGVDGLAASMLVAAVVVTPLGGWAVVGALTDPVALLAGAGVGISSSVIPYVCDQLAMRRLARATYALMVSLLPATATVVGILVLTQVPSVREAAGVLLVVAGVAVHRDNGPVAVDVLTEIEIARPRAEVAAYAGDPDNATEWYENIKTVEWETPPPLAVGSRLAFAAEFLGRRLAYTYAITDLVPGERLVMRTAQGPFPMETTYTWSDAGAGATRMTLRNRGEPSGFKQIAAPLMARQMRRANEKDLRRLKEILEAGRSSA